MMLLIYKSWYNDDGFTVSTCSIPTYFTYKYYYNWYSGHETDFKIGLKINILKQLNRYREIIQKL